MPTKNQPSHKTINRKPQPHCQCCGRFLKPDPHVGERQKVCARPRCQKTRKRNQEKRWLNANPGYFKGRYPNTVAWRDDHPDHQKTWRKSHRSGPVYEIQTQCSPPNPVFSMVVQLRAKHLREIQTQLLSIRHTRGGFAIHGASPAGP